MKSPKRILFRLEFDGRNFCGWQLQADAFEEQKPSIQGEVERAIQTVLHSPSRISVKGCGRTDAGVSAREYFCHFDLEDFDQELEKFRHAVSCVLPEGIAVLSAAFVPASFHAADSVVSKTYEYRLLLRRSKPTLDAGRCWWIPLDSSNFSVEKLTQASSAFLGEHDFRAFAAANHQAATTLRKVDELRVDSNPLFKDSLDSGIEIRLKFKARGFLKQMVRNMVGALTEVAQGKKSREDLVRLLSTAADRKDAGFCAPAEGLTLLRVEYERNV